MLSILSAFTLIFLKIVDIKRASKLKFSTNLF